MTMIASDLGRSGTATNLKYFSHVYPEQLYTVQYFQIFINYTINKSTFRLIFNYFLNNYYFLKPFRYRSG